MSTPLDEGTGWTPRHTVEELNECALAAQAGDEKAKDQLVTMMRPYLVNFLRKVPGDYTRDQRDEMTAAALVGLWEGLKRYDPAKQDPRGQRKFSNYALNWVRHEVNEWRAKNSRALPIPRQAWHFAKKIEDEYERRYGEDADITRATDEELTAIDIGVIRKGEEKTINVNYAGDAIRARRMPLTIDDNAERSTQSAEDEYMDTVDEEADLRAIAIIRGHQMMLEALPEADWLPATEQLCEEMGWDPQAAEAIIEEMPL